MNCLFVACKQTVLSHYIAQHDSMEAFTAVRPSMFTEITVSAVGRP